MRAVLIKNDVWGYASGTFQKNDLVAGNEESQQAVEKWTQDDLKAQSDIVLTNNPSELKQVRTCKTAREIWTKLSNIRQSDEEKSCPIEPTHFSQNAGGRRRAAEHASVHVHCRSRWKSTLTETVILLKSLPDLLEVLQCAITARDDLPDPKTFRVKIMEECQVKPAIEERYSGLNRRRRSMLYRRTTAWSTLAENLTILFEATE